MESGIEFEEDPTQNNKQTKSVMESPKIPTILLSEYAGWRAREGEIVSLLPPPEPNYPSCLQY